MVHSACMRWWWGPNYMSLWKQPLLSVAFWIDKLILLLCEWRCNVLPDRLRLPSTWSTVWRLIIKARSLQTKFATHGSAGVIVISFVFWWVKYDVWASAFQMSLHWSRAPISLGKDNHFLFCLLSWEMEEGAAEVGESQMDITLTFEEWKANKRVTGEEGKLNLPFQRLFFPSYLSWLSCALS